MKKIKPIILIILFSTVLKLLAAQYNDLKLPKKVDSRKKFYELINCAYLSNELKDFRKAKVFLDSAEEIISVEKGNDLLYNYYLCKGVVFYNKSTQDENYRGAAIKNLSEAFKLNNKGGKDDDKNSSDLFLITDLLKRCYANGKNPYFFNDPNDSPFKDEAKLSEKVASLNYITQKILYTKRIPEDYDLFIKQSLEIKDPALRQRMLTQIGLAFKNLNEPDSAAKFLQMATTVAFKNPNKNQEVKLVEDIKENSNFEYRKMGDETTDNIFSAIEIGSKGVKMVVLSVSHDYQGNYSYNTKFDTAINTEFITFTNNSIRETINAVDKFYNISLERFEIAKKHIFLAISSGVYDMAYRREDNENPVVLKELSKKLRERLFAKYNEVVHVLTITPDIEANLIHLGTVHKEEKDLFLVVDIGSGNTKGGSFNSDGGFNSFTFPMGTSSFSDSIFRSTPTINNILDFEQSTKKLNDTYLKQQIKDATRGGTTNKSYILFTGGIAWAIARILYPENQDKAYVKTTIADVELFRKKILKELDNIKSFKLDVLTDIYDDKIKAKAENQLDLVFSAFDQQKLLAGSQIMLEIMKQFNAVAPKKTFALAPYGYIGWVTGIIIKELSGSL